MKLMTICPAKTEHMKSRRDTLRLFSWFLMHLDQVVLLTMVHQDPVDLWTTTAPPWLTPLTHTVQSYLVHSPLLQEKIPGVNIPHNSAGWQVGAQEIRGVMDNSGKVAGSVKGNAFSLTIASGTCACLPALLLISTEE